MDSQVLNSYPSIYNLGHAAVAQLLDGPVIVEEKVDGSQISFGIDTEGTLHIKSKGAVIHPEAPNGMFKAGVGVILGLAPLLTPGWTYRGEYLSKPKHNTLAYDRIPENHIIIFDIEKGYYEYLSPSYKLVEATRLGLEVVPVLYNGMVTDKEAFQGLLETMSVLGGQKVEGVVVKPQSYDLWGVDKKVLMGKYVSEAFKEVHQGAWREANPHTGDIIEQIIVAHRTPARWQKAVQHLRESGGLTDSPKDIGPLIQEVLADVRKEEEGAIKDVLFAYAWKKIGRGITNGLPEWYKENLLEKAFEGIDAIEETNRTGD